jgi:hypothetical protein
MTDDDLLRELYRAGGAHHAAGAGSGCRVTHERMVALLEGRLGRKERLDTMRQILDHPACREEFALLRTAWEAAGGNERRRRPAVGVLVRAAAAAVVLFVAASVVVMLEWNRREEPMRGPVAGFELIAPRGTVDGGALQLVWHPWAGADRYEVTVADSGGVPVLTRTTSDTSVGVTPLAPGHYRWWARATRPDGATERSAIQFFIVSR